MLEFMRGLSPVLVILFIRLALASLRAWHAGTICSRCRSLR